MDDFIYLTPMISPVLNNSTNLNNSMSSYIIFFYGWVIIFGYFFYMVFKKFYQHNKNIINMDVFFIENDDNIDINENCSICLDNFDNKKLKTLKCKHNFHADCIIAWLEIKQECPNCRNRLIV